MKASWLPLLFLVFFCSFSGKDTSFRKEQLKAPKVAEAYREKWPGIKARLTQMHIDTGAFRVFIRVFKEEKKVELWVSSGPGSSFQLYADYPVCSSSGNPGPKRREGDGQVPEGFYTVNVFNPYSNYYVSLGLSYPNASDRILGDKHSLGGNIMIHGNCVTIGCIPITDDKIKEVYVLASEARNTGQKDIPVHVFPEALNPVNMSLLEKSYASNPALLAFWKNLKTGYDYFEGKHQLPSVSVSDNGKYIFR